MNRFLIQFITFMTSRRGLKRPLDRRETLYQNDHKTAIPETVLRSITRTYIWLWIIQISRGFWPALSAGLTTFGLLRLELISSSPLPSPLTQLNSITLCFYICAALFLWGCFRLQIPSQYEAIAAVDHSLPHTPIAHLLDQNALTTQLGDAQAQSTQDLWDAHQQLVQATLSRAQAVYPSANLSRYDPYGLRLIALLIGLSGLIFGTGSVSLNLHMLAPEQRNSSTQNTPSWEGWITPPAYTQKRPIALLSSTPSTLSVPIGSSVTVFVYGHKDQFSLTQTLTSRPAEQQEDDKYAFMVEHTGTLEVSSSENHSWSIRATEDHAPYAELTGPVERRASGQLAQPFRAEDDYGITQGQAKATLDLTQVIRKYGLAPMPDDTASLVINIPSPAPQNRTDYDAFLTTDISKHLLSNMPVTLELQVQDASTQSSTSSPERLTLPGQRFFHPLAKTLIEQRRDVMWSHTNLPRAIRLLKAVTYRPNPSLKAEGAQQGPQETALGAFPNVDAYLKVTQLISQLEQHSQQHSSTPIEDNINALTPHVEALWHIAQYIEDGQGLSSIEARLEHAQTRVNEAVTYGASATEIAALMDELRAATKEHLRNLARQADPNDTDTPDDGTRDSPAITQDQIQALMDEIERLTAEGRLEEAQQLTQKLNDLLKNLEVSPQSGQGDGSSSGQGENGGAQTPQSSLRGILKEQEKIADDLFQGVQRAPDADQKQYSEDFSKKQRDLEQQLRAQRQALPWVPGAQGQAGRDALDQAQEHMKRAQDQLRDSETTSALDSQSQAIDALRDAINSFNSPEADSAPQGELTEGPQGSATRSGPRGQNGQQDPLGRVIGTGQDGQSGEGDVGEGARQEQLKTLDRTLKDRAKDFGRSETERSYISRLLERF